MLGIALEGYESIIGDDRVVVEDKRVLIFAVVDHIKILLIHIVGQWSFLIVRIWLASHYIVFEILQIGL